MIVRVMEQPFRSTTEPPPFSAFPSFVHALHANVSNIIRAVSEYEIVWKWNGKRRSASIWCFLLSERGVPSPRVMKTNFEDGPCSTRNRAESIFHRAMSNSGPEDSRRILERLTANFYLFSYLFIIVRNVENKRFRFRSLRLNMYIVKYVDEKRYCATVEKLLQGTSKIQTLYCVHRYFSNIQSTPVDRK